MACYFPYWKDGTPLPCGKCPSCRLDRLNNWSFRLMQHLKHSKCGYFVTLTYLDPPMTDNGMMTLRKYDLQKFWKRLRKKYGKSLKYYAVGEYGTRTQRPHYHAIIFNASREDIEKAWNGFSRLDDPEGCILGYTHYGDVTEASIAYCAKYLDKAHNNKIPMFKGDLRDKEFQTFSKDLAFSL